MAEAKDEYGLTQRHRAFCDQQLREPELNANEVYKALYNCKDSAAISGASRLNKNPEVQAYMAMRRAKLADNLGISQQRILDEYAKIAFSNAADFVDWDDGVIRIRPADQLNRNQTAAVSEISQTVNQNGVNVKIKLYDKKGALDSLARHLQMFVDKQEIEVTGIGDLMAEIAANNGGSTVSLINQRKEQANEQKDDANDAG